MSEAWNCADKPDYNPNASSSTKYSDQNQHRNTKWITNLNHSHEFENNNVVNLIPEPSNALKKREMDSWQSISNILFFYIVCQSWDPIILNVPDFYR